MLYVFRRIIKRKLPLKKMYREVERNNKNVESKY